MSHDDDDDFRPRRRRDDDFDDRPRRRRDDDDDDYRGGRRDSRDRLVQSKVAAPAIILMVFGAIITLWTTYSLVMHLVNPEQQIKQTYEIYRQFLEGFKKGQQNQNPPNNKPAPELPKGVVKNAPLKQGILNNEQDDKKEDAQKGVNKQVDKDKKEDAQKKDANKQVDENEAPPLDPDIMTYEEFKKMYQGGAIGGIIVQILYGLILLVGGFKMKQLSGYGFSVFTSIVAMLPCITCCCLPTPIGLWALIVLMSPDVKDGFSMNRSR